ncbi:MAG: Hsp20/alpha crystallin family protein [Bacilli bacterium]|nr:Hsp20/alpha crystallin family protein [Bacilli bacterium]
MSLIPRSFYLDDIFDEFGRTPRTNDMMKCDVYEKDGNYNIEMDIPGYDKKDIKIECDNNVLTIVAEKQAENNEEDENKKYIRRERVYGKVSRTFNFADIDEEAIKAEFTNGILKIVVPKKEKVETRKVIEID